MESSISNIDRKISKLESEINPKTPQINIEYLTSAIDLGISVSKIEYEKLHPQVKDPLQ